MILPRYFYDLQAPVTLNCYGGVPRWYDEFSDTNGEEKIILSRAQLQERMCREIAYTKWLKAFHIRNRIQKFQVIRVLTTEHSEKTTKDFWGKYQDALFRVFLNPYTKYSTDDNKSYYILSPEDCFLLHAFEAETAGFSVPRRSSFRFICGAKELRAALVIPTECCHHLRNETYGGKMRDQDRVVL